MSSKGEALHPAAIAVMAVGALREAAFPIIVLLGASLAGRGLDSAALQRSAAYLVLGVAVASFVGLLRWRRWRYEVRDAEIDLLHGTVRITRTLVPMLRVQHVDTTRGPLDQLLGLATVVVHTAAGKTTIPALDEEYAGRLRDQIAVLARTADEL